MITYPIDFDRIVDAFQWVSEWNEKYPSGTLVGVWKDNGELFITRTKGQARVYGLETHSTATIFLEGVSGFYHLGAVRPITVHPSLSITS